jgi:superoxide dismutase
MNDAASDIKNIADEVDKAVKKHEKDNKGLDFTEAAKMAKKLEETGKKAQELKVKQIEQVKVGDEEAKADLERRFKSQINSAFAGLMDAKKKLNESLQKAEAIDREKVD